MDKLQLFALFEVLKVKCTSQRHGNYVLISAGILVLNIHLVFDEESLHLPMLRERLLVFACIFPDSKAFVLKPIQEHDVSFHFDGGFFAYEFQQ